MAKKRPINVLGVKLKQGRERGGMSEEDAAVKLVDNGITVKDIKDYEGGFDLPSEERLSAMCQLYNISFIEMKAILDEALYNDKNKKKVYRNKFVGRTFWDDFGDVIVKIVKIIIAMAILFIIIRSGVIDKIKELAEPVDNTSENYVVDDEYLRMLNSKNGQKTFRDKE